MHRLLPTDISVSGEALFSHNGRRAASGLRTPLQNYSFGVETQLLVIFWSNEKIYLCTRLRCPDPFISSEYLMLPVSRLVHLSEFSFVLLPLETRTNSAQLIASWLSHTLRHSRRPLGDRFFGAIRFDCFFCFFFFFITNGSISKDWELVAYQGSW